MTISTISMFFILLTVSAAIVNNMGLFLEGVPIDTTSMDNARLKVNYDSYLQSQGAQQQTSFDFGDFKTALSMLRDILFGVAWIPGLLEDFGLPGNLAYLFSLPIYIIYAIGFTQFIGNRSMKGMS